MNPNGCRICGLDERDHMQRWSKAVGWHTWTPPTQAQIKRRMQDRRTARLNAEPPKYHAVTGWAADHTESGEPYCADCKTDGCRQWIRIQARLDQQRWGASFRAKHSLNAQPGGWGGDEPF